MVESARGGGETLPIPCRAVLADLRLACDAAQLGYSLGLKSGGRRVNELADMVRQACDTARPKVAYRLMRADYDEQGRLVLEGGVTVSSVPVGKALQGARTVVVFMATCGREIETWAVRFASPLHHFWADVLMGLALDQAIATLERRLAVHPGLGLLGRVEPGIPGDWPVTELAALARLLGDTRALIGVELNAYGMMRPLKSVAGLLFPVRAKAHKCDLCACERCPQRDARRGGPGES